MRTCQFHRVRGIELLNYIEKKFNSVIEHGILGKKARNRCFLASDWLKSETLPRKYRTLFVIEHMIPMSECPSALKVAVQINL